LDETLSRSETFHVCRAREGPRPHGNLLTPPWGGVACPTVKTTDRPFLVNVVYDDNFFMFQDDKLATAFEEQLLIKR